MSFNTDEIRGNKEYYVIENPFAPNRYADIKLCEEVVELRQAFKSTVPEFIVKLEQKTSLYTEYAKLKNAFRGLMSSITTSIPEEIKKLDSINNDPVRVRYVLPQVDSYNAEDQLNKLRDNGFYSLSEDEFNNINSEKEKLQKALQSLKQMGPEVIKEINDLKTKNNQLNTAIARLEAMQKQQASQKPMPPIVHIVYRPEDGTSLEDFMPDYSAQNATGPFLQEGSLMAPLDNFLNSALRSVEEPSSNLNVSNL